MHFGDLLELYLGKTGQPLARIAKLSNIPKTTLYTWFGSGSQQPRSWRQILHLCRALQLTEGEADLLLNAAKHQTIDSYREMAVLEGDDELHQLLAFWPISDEDGTPSPFLAPARHTDKIFGRDELIVEVSQQLYDSHHCVLYGMPGVGKTSIAIEIAYQLSHLFPDGVLWANLSQVVAGDTPSDEERLMACFYTLIQAFGRDATEAQTLESREVVLREVLQHKKALIILDSVPNTAILNHFLPSEKSQCVLLVTTHNRRVLRGRATHFAVDVLTLDDSKALLRHKLGDESGRIESEVQYVDQVVELVDGHPLALELVASGVEFLSFEEYLHELKDEQIQLEYLADWEDVNKNIKAVFQLSYKRLPEHERALFNYVALFKSGHFSTAALAYVSQQSDVKVKRMLAHLQILSFLSPFAIESDDDEEHKLSGHFQVHNLLRVFANYQLTRLDLDKQRLYKRLADHYTDYCHAKAQIQSYQQVDIEWENIEMVANEMVQQANKIIVVEFVLALTHYWVGSFGYLDLRGKYRQALTWLDWLNSLDRSTNPDLTIRHGVFAFKLNDFVQAETLFEQSLQLLRQQEMTVAETILRQSYIADYLARIKLQTSSEEARDLLEESIANLKQLDSEIAQHQQGHLQIILGEVLAKSFGRMDPAIHEMEIGLSFLPEQLTPSHLKGFITLSVATALIGDIARRDKYTQRAIEAAEELGDLYRAAAGYMNQGINLQNADDFELAKKMNLRAQRLFRQIGDDISLASAKNNLGYTFLTAHRYDQARPQLEDAVELSARYYDTRPQAYPLATLAELEIAEARYEPAMDLLQRAFQICHTTENVILMPYVLAHMAFISIEQSQTDLALQQIQQSLQLAQSNQIVEAEGIAQSIKGYLLDQLGDFGPAREAHDKALQLLENQSEYEFGKAQARFAQHKSKLN